MAKYHVEIQPKNLWDDPITKDIVALNAEQARTIATTFYKGGSVTKCARIGKDSEATSDVLNGMVEVMQSAIASGDEDIYEQQKTAFEETVKSLKSHSNVVAWNIIKKEIPDIPVM